MSLLDEAKESTVRSGPVSTIDALVARLLADGRAVDADEVTELLKAPVVGHAAAARVIMRHFGDEVERKITHGMVLTWRSANL